MESRKKIISYIGIYITVTYVISGIGYFVWLQPEPNEAAAFIPILAPLIGAYAVYFSSKRSIELNIKRFSLKGIVIGSCLPAGYILMSLTLFLIMGNSVNALNITGEQIILLFGQWIFAGFCEEIGWRGVLLPMLKKIVRLQHASIITGFVWAGWHVPMILGGVMITGQTKIMGIILFSIEAICISLILGVLSETKVGSSIWTYVSFHAAHNIILVALMTAVSKADYIYLDDGGYILVSVLLILTIISLIYLTSITDNDIL